MNRFQWGVRCLLVWVWGLGGGEVWAQALVLKDGSRVPAEQFKIENGKIIRSVQLQGNNRSTMELPMAAVLELEWPYVQELVDARELLVQGRTGEAIDRLKAGLAFLEPFKDIRGGQQLHAELLFTYVQTLGRSGAFEETVRLLPEVSRLPLTAHQQGRLQVLKLDIERQTSSDYDVLMAKADNILAETDDSEVGAVVWSIIGDIHAKKKDWEAALMAYLRIPVFYGSQLQQVPKAELNAARMLAKMRRFGDAQQYLDRLIERYPGSVIGDEAASEKAAINGMKNEEPNPKKAPSEPQAS